ncbi:hypothetical protein AZO1586I_104 [Bathymodiolus thermophilus thioautotrophic gill symbiont]|jgi:hypothetical protein|uniref:Uncharacterized protein n=3 Tax=sulfur-oxidizing symbionts TaxID=32036 RepID=A0ACA8ZTR9_9GAMM|nr:MULTISPECIES: hypothetical protein [sulfur-oxidizing symbionts]CAC5826146.1 hypothetical protein [uncultured Gammaproteobacteria bacterium]CAB5497038.1 hypothetical protein AZO1586I_104 [Bathymodiolus thermophilus thioautotrophic gill symbiont]CAB5502099.1 hypothetical protein AZO1586R_1376 [Bathymodiolus azoricus thioautotrophic gill symbiont]CAC9504383.1 hypothetical protein [uncultured Gammaproteobacteria bacterium]CAC9519104.1 hypothetical protein [uncultured Gammaproteobacteria bacteri
MQRKKLLDLLTEYYNQQGGRTFSLKQLNKYYQDYSIIGINGNTPQATIRRLLQELRNNNMLTFLPEQGFYTLGGKNLDFLWFFQILSG